MFDFVYHGLPSVLVRLSLLSHVCFVFAFGIYRTQHLTCSNPTISSNALSVFTKPSCLCIFWDYWGTLFILLSLSSIDCSCVFIVISLNHRFVGIFLCPLWQKGVECVLFEGSWVASIWGGDCMLFVFGVYDVVMLNEFLMAIWYTNSCMDVVK
jgi:hypothetical protein